MGLRELIELAYDYPLVFLQVDHDAELAAEKSAASGKDGKPSWRKPGEKAVDARDRLRAEREEAKRRLGVS